MYPTHCNKAAKASLKLEVASGDPEIRFKSAIGTERTKPRLKIVEQLERVLIVLKYGVCVGIQIAKWRRWSAHLDG